MICARSLTHRIGLIIALLASAAAIASPAWAVTLKEEVELGQRLDQEILKQTPLSTDHQAQTDMDEYGQKLVQGVKRPEIRYHFRIIKDEDLNAFAVPGGYVYFTDRLWNVLRKDERIGVLAHEIVHVDRRHSLDALSKARRRQIWLAVLLTAVKANQTWADVADMLHSVYSLKYSRADERQADEVGVELLRQAGYNPAGLLLAMRKINRFQAEHGGEPPKIFSSHPPTPERLEYLESLLVEMKVAVPSEKPVREEGSNRIGDVIGVERDTVQFVSSKTLREGDVVWLMTPGWDYYYEKYSPTPAARAIVTRTGRTYLAGVRLLPDVNGKLITKGVGVYYPPKPGPEKGAARLEAAGGAPGLVSPTPVRRLDRFLARQVVWSKDRTKLTYDNIGYVVVTEPASPPRYVAASRTVYSYAPLASGADLQRVTDPDAGRWLGPVNSIGRGGETIELLTARDVAQLEADMRTGKRFDVVLPPWDSRERYQDRVVGKAVLKSLDRKIVLQMLDYSPGWSINALETAFDIYESPPDKDDSK